MQFLVDLYSRSATLPLPNFLKDQIKKQDLTDVEKLEEFFLSELQSLSLQEKQYVDLFFFMTKSSLMYAFLRQDQSLYQEFDGIIQHRMTALRSVQHENLPIQAWNSFLKFLNGAFQRLVKHVAIEEFEEQINALDWGSFDQEFIGDLSTIIGFVYANEDDPDQSSKARIWLMKAMGECPLPQGIGVHMIQADYYLNSGLTDGYQHANHILIKIKDAAEASTDLAIKNLFSQVAFELEGALLNWNFHQKDDSLTRLETSQLQLKEYETRFAQKDKLNSFSKAQVESLIARMYSGLYKMTSDDLEQASFAKHIVKHSDQAIEAVQAVKDEQSTLAYRLLKAQLSVSTGSALTEKEMKELTQAFKKEQNYPLYTQSIQCYIDLLLRNEVPRKSYDLIQDVMKFAQKRIEQGGFYLTTAAFSIANNIFHAETTEPGVSWMTDILDNFFDKISQALQDIETYRESIGKSLIENFRKIFITFEPVSHFHIKVYYRYQLAEIQIMRIGAIINEDPVSLNVADNLLSSISDKNNPLSFMNAEWDEFKSVPNSVRNRTLNKCINISKGDLPLAAEHLDFSYRNLRSYITFKEVNRLGFFLDMQQTSNRQLEQGIRYMFYDLYKKGTIFEVVFDMPKFLVNYAKSGFYSQDLEQELNIKGTTAKKYIKIMMEIGLIRQDKTTGRKHYYRLVRENVMNRLGKDQNTLIQSS
ncbi:MAG: helix-turn-helix domain-containing protein [Bacteroidota bacterium]